ncbi:hypothetical protein ACVWWI_000247 [Bradyrhizobium sp. USDA 3686]|nr:hypothetical protein [Bradyrhizobium canariense]UFW72355.1 histidine phosphatase family protein [Bradyrhizobium canariense]
MNVLCRLAFVILLCGSTQAAAADSSQLIASLKQGGYVLVFRHTATDDSQKDVYPFKFDDMSAQRQLSEKGRDMARQIGTAIKELAIPIGDVYTSRLNRAIEAGRLISGREIKPVDALTDSSNASASGMANPTGANAKAGQAVRQLVDAPPKAGTNLPGHPQDQHRRCLRQGCRGRSGRRSFRLPGKHHRCGGFRRTHQACGLDREGRQVSHLPATHVSLGAEQAGRSASLRAPTG